MTDEVQRELQSIKGMVLAWKQSYLAEAPPPGEDGEYLLLDFQQEIETHVYPYAMRLYECNYLSSSETREFLEFCQSQVLELQATLTAGT